MYVYFILQFDFFHFLASLIAIVGGVIVGWCSTCVDLLISDESPLPFGKITLEEASWVSSLMQLGAFCSPISMCFGFITNKFGRKWPLLFITIPLLVHTNHILWTKASAILEIFFILDEYIAVLVCTKCLSFVCFTIAWWPIYSWRLCDSFAIFK